MSKKKRESWVWTIFFFVLGMAAIFGCVNGYEVYRMRQEVRQAQDVKEQLLQEKAEMEKRKEELQNPDVIERKARDDLGMVKPGEVPYVK